MLDHTSALGFENIVINKSKDSVFLLSLGAFPLMRLMSVVSLFLISVHSNLSLLFLFLFIYLFCLLPDKERARMTYIPAERQEHS